MTISKAWIDEDNGPWLLGLVVFVVALWAQSGALAGVFYDDGIYLVLAKSLSSGEGYRYLNLPGTPAAVHYPPFYPFVLSLLWRIWPTFPANLALFSLADSAFLSAAAVIIARHSVRLGIPRAVRFSVLLAGFIAFPLLAIVAMRFSEPLFLLLLAAAITTVDHRRLVLRNVLLAGLLAGLATLTRSLGAAVIVATVAVLLWRRRPGYAAVFMGAAALTLAPWLVWLQTHASGIDPRLISVYGSYGKLAGEIGPGAFLGGADLRVFGPPARLLLPALADGAWWVLAFVLGATTVLGAVQLFRKSPTLLSTLAVYVAVVTVWPYAPDRFVWVILPWWFMVLAAGILRVYRVSAVGRVAASLVVAVTVVGFVPREFASLKSHRFTSTAEEISAPFSLLLPTVIQELPATALLASGDEALVYLYTGRRAVPATLAGVRNGELAPIGARETVDFYCEKGVTHIFDSGPGDQVRSVVDSLHVVHEATVEPLFSVADGPALLELSCPS